jgi:hypothetical protein
MHTEKLHSDGLISITRDTITLRHYYFIGISKKIPVSEIEKIASHEPTASNGKWRIWGGGGFNHWFPFDILRPIRERIFFAKLKNKSFVIGFTVSNSRLVENIFRDMNLLE